MLEAALRLRPVGMGHADRPMTEMGQHTPRHSLQPRYLSLGCSTCRLRSAPAPDVSAEPRQFSLQYAVADYVIGADNKPSTSVTTIPERSGESRPATAYPRHLQHSRIRFIRF